MLVGLALPFGVAGPKGEVFDRRSFEHATYQGTVLCASDHGRHALARHGETLAIWIGEEGLHFVARIDGLTAPIYKALAERPGRLGASIGGVIVTAGSRAYVGKVKDLALLQHGATGRHGSYAPAFKTTWVRPIAALSGPIRKRAEAELAALARPARDRVAVFSDKRRAAGSAPMPVGTRHRNRCSIASAVRNSRTLACTRTLRRRCLARAGCAAVPSPERSSGESGTGRRGGDPRPAGFFGSL